MAQQHDTLPFQHLHLQTAAQLGAADMQASIAFWLQWPAIMAGAMQTPDPAQNDRQERDKAATAKVVVAQIDLMRNLTESINAKTPVLAAAPLKPVHRSVKAKPRSKRRRKG